MILNERRFTRVGKPYQLRGRTKRASRCRSPVPGSGVGARRAPVPLGFGCSCPYRLGEGSSSSPPNPPVRVHRALLLQGVPRQTTQVHYACQEQGDRGPRLTVCRDRCRPARRIIRRDAFAISVAVRFRTNPETFVAS